ncbi:MAG: M3 family oligoendopeptidase [Chloroflexi bacterium]|nr:M3 family oligoendopeptidase [Chloroflexota bacterium]
MNSTETYTPSAWSLSDLFPSKDGPEIEAAFRTLEEKVAAVEKRRPSLSSDISTGAFMDLVRQIEEINRLGDVLYSYAGLWFAGDTQDQVAQALVARIDQFAAQLGNRVLFFSLWWKSLDDTHATRLMEDSGDYRYWLEEMRHFKPHTLTEPEEKIINIKNVTGVSALGMLYDSITNRYTFHLEVDGEPKELTRGELMVFARHHDAGLRERAYRELYRVYGNDGPILGQMYQTLVRDWRNEQVDLRHFPTPISARNLGNDIPDDVVDTLLEVSRSNASLFQRYFRLKARWLGMERLRRYDIYAPVAVSDKMYSFRDAAELVFDSFNEFHPQFAGLARRVFDQKHLDSEVRKGKRGGAFCWSVAPELTPWVLVNFQGHPDDAATLAHELGHAIHTMLASQHTLFTFHASLPLAETASTFGEMVLIDRLLAQEEDQSVRRDLLFRQVDDAYATIMRQTFFALFERQAHDMIQSNASVDQLSEAYIENLSQQFGESVEIGPEFRWEWVSIPHIYNTPFYVYAYAFGQLLVLSLYRQYKTEGEAFKPRYLRILSTGGSQAPVTLLAEAGIDVRQARFWQGGFDVIRGLIEQLEALPVEK